MLSSPRKLKMKWFRVKFVRVQLLISSYLVRRQLHVTASMNSFINTPAGGEFSSSCIVMAHGGY